jgi:hypothetical protein
MPVRLMFEVQIMLTNILLLLLHFGFWGKQGARTRRFPLMADGN